jgi:5-methylcytosine-specific restriction enzyme subunit McrC
MHLILTEGAPAQLVELDRAVADALRESDVAMVEYTDSSDQWLLSAAGKIGVVRVGHVQVTVKPKVGIDRLVFMMGYARNPSYWLDDRVRLDPDMDFPEALAEAFRRLATRALEQGLLKGYRSVDDTTSVMRGRIREADQIKRRFGRLIPLEVRYDDFTVDIAENQLLLGAAQRLLRMPGLGRRTRHSLQRLRLQLADVTTPTRGQERPFWRPSRLNARYVPALQVAEMILDGRSFEQRVGDLTVTGFLFSMATIFEDFVCVALREQMKPYGGSSALQYKTHLDVAETVRIRPDFVWKRDRVPQVVADAKYKAEKPAGFPQADLYQLLAYCTVLGLPEGHLVYAKGEEPARLVEVAGNPVRIHCHTLDLTVSPTRLLEQMRTLAARMQRVQRGRLAVASPDPHAAHT